MTLHNGHSVPPGVAPMPSFSPAADARDKYYNNLALLESICLLQSLWQARLPRRARALLAMTTAVIASEARQSLWQARLPRRAGALLAMTMTAVACIFDIFNGGEVFRLVDLEI